MPTFSKQPGRARLWPIFAALALSLLVLPACGDDEPAPAPQASTQATTPPAAADAPEAASEETIIAIVGDSKITAKDLAMMQTAISSQTGGSEDPATAQEDALQVLEVLISRQAAVKLALDSGYAPSDAEVEDAVSQLVERNGGQEAFEMSLSQFGMTLEDLKRQIVETMAISTWRDMAFLASSKVSDEEARTFYDEHIEEAKHDDQARALQIMVPVPMVAGQNEEAVRADVKARAEELLKAAKAGEDFEALIQRGMDQATLAAIDNGRLGWVTKGLTGFPELEEVIFSLKPGEVGGLIESPFSYHIVKVLETRPAGTFSFEEIRPEIVELLTDTKIDNAVRQQLLELRRTAKVEIIDPELAKAWPAFQAKLQAEIAAFEAAGDVPAANEAPAAGDAPAADEAPSESEASATGENQTPDKGAAAQ